MRSDDHVLPPPLLAGHARWRLWRLWLMVGLLTLGGCSILQTLYHQAPKYFLWRSNLAFHYNDAQYELAKAHLRQWFEWQRTQQMPQIARFLNRGKAEVLGHISPALACERREETERWARDGIDQAAPRLAQLALSLSPRQISHLEGFFKDKNEDFTDDFLPLDPQERHRVATAFVLKWASLIYGDFNEVQRQQLQADLARLPFDAATILQQFQRFQVSYVKLVRDAQSQHWSRELMQARIKALLLDGIDPQEPARQAEMQRWIQSGCQLAADFHNRTTPAQRAKAAKQLATWEVDATELSQEG